MVLLIPYYLKIRVRANQGIPGREDKVFCEGLGDEQAIEWILV